MRRSSVSFVLCFLLTGAGLSACQPVVESATPNPSLLSDPIDRTAATLLDELQVRSFAEDREFCGFIGYDLFGRLLVTEAVSGERDGCRPQYSSMMRRVVASYHTHGASSRYAETELPSTEDLAADLYEGIDGYIATPGGRLWKISHAHKAAYLICGAGCVRADPRHHECPGDAPATEHTVQTLYQQLGQSRNNC